MNENSGCTSRIRWNEQEIIWTLYLTWYHAVEEDFGLQLGLGN